MQKSKTITRLLCIVVAISLILGVAPIINASAVSPFRDVSDSSYYYTEVISVYEQGVISGNGDGTFLPENHVKNSEALKLVCSMAGIQYAGYSGVSSPWYADVVSWAKNHGIVSADIDPEKAATREQISQYIISVYKLSTDTSTNVFLDTTSKAANVLYDYGVIKGILKDDGTVSFGGEQNVKRCDICIMLYRLNAKVPKPVWPTAVALDRSHYSVSRPASFSTFDDYVNAWKYMIVNADFGETFQVNLTCTKAQLQKLGSNIQDAYNFAMFDYMEYASFLNQWGVGISYYTDSSGNCINPKFTLSLSNSRGLSQNEVLSEISSFNTTCAQIVIALYNDGSLKSGMTVKEKAHVLYVYTAYHTKYDTSYQLYNGYDAAVRGSAVCQGYTAMYNYLCNLAGVRMEAMTGNVSNSDHAWSRIYVDGSWYNIDTTWSDPIPDKPNYCNEKWFWVTDSFLKSGSEPRTFDCDTLVYG